MKNIIFMKVIIFLSLFAIALCGCGEEDVQVNEWAQDDGFRKHSVRFCDENDSIHWQYHMEPEDCPGESVDLCDTCTYKKRFQNYVEYYDTKERIMGK